MAALADRAPKTESETSKVDPNAPPAQPSARATPTADPSTVQPPAPSAAPLQPPTDPRHSDPAYWKQRFSVTAGVLERERAERLAAENAFQQRVAELQAQVASLQAGAPAPQVDLKQLLTQEQIDALGEEEANAVVAAAVKAAEQAAQRVLDGHIKPLQERAAQDQTQADRGRKQSFTDRLSELVPDWNTIDAEEGWLTWLGAEDETTGMPRQQILNTHVGRYDAAKAAKMFRAYKDLMAPPIPPVAPHGSGATSAGEILQPDALASRPLSSQEIKDFFKSSALGKVTNEERVAFEKRRQLPRR
jgi:hypothetical protein